MTMIGEPQHGGEHLVPLRGISSDRAAALAAFRVQADAGQNNRLLVLDVIDAALRLFRAHRRIGISADHARAAYAANMAALETRLREFGLAAAEVEELVHKYRDLPDE